MIPRPRRPGDEDRPSVDELIRQLERNRIRRRAVVEAWTAGLVAGAVLVLVLISLLWPLLR